MFPFSQSVLPVFSLGSSTTSTRGGTTLFRLRDVSPVPPQGDDLDAEQISSVDDSHLSAEAVKKLFDDPLCPPALSHYADPYPATDPTNNQLVPYRGVTIRLATIRYISRYTTHDMVYDTIQNQLIYYQWKILKHCGMCHQYCYIKTVILARNSEFKINKDVHNHPCPKYLLLPNGVCKQNNKIS